MRHYYFIPSHTVSTVSSRFKLVVISTWVYGLTLYSGVASAQELSQPAILNKEIAKCGANPNNASLIGNLYHNEATGIWSFHSVENRIITKNKSITIETQINTLQTVSKISVIPIKGPSFIVQAQCEKNCGISTQEHFQPQYVRMETPIHLFPVAYCSKKKEAEDLAALLQSELTTSVGP